MSGNKGLGRGLDALFAHTAANQENKDNKEQQSVQAVENLHPNPQQPRRQFDANALRELGDSIKSQGILQPLLVRPFKDRQGYEIVAGERRWRAAKLAGLREVPVFIREMDDNAVMIVTLIENLQREDLNPIEEAEALQVLRDTLHKTQEEIAEQLGKSRSAIANALRLLQLSPEARKDLQEGRLTAGHGRCLLSIEDVDAMETLRLRILSANLTVRQAEVAVASWKANGIFPWQLAQENQGKPRQKSPQVKQLQQHLRSHLGCRASISGTEEKGRITFSYASHAELQKLMQQWGISVQEMVEDATD